MGFNPTCVLTTEVDKISHWAKHQSLLSWSRVLLLVFVKSASSPDTEASQQTWDQGTGGMQQRTTRGVDDGMKSEIVFKFRMKCRCASRTHETLFNPLYNFVTSVLDYLPIVRGWVICTKVFISIYFKSFKSNHCMLSRLFWVIGVACYSASVLGRGSDQILGAFLHEATHYRRRTQSHITVWCWNHSALPLRANGLFENAFTT